MCENNFSPKKVFEEYFVSFAFNKVIANGATISSATVKVVDSSGNDVTSSLTDVTKQKIVSYNVFIWIQGGISKMKYHISCQIVCSDGEEYEGDSYLYVE
jgi:methionine-rich copper-binding protein CopC